MRLRYIYSACIVITTDDCTILCDPWHSPAYEGAWVQWPQWAKNLDEAVEICGPADYVFASHGHPDHYDPAFLKLYLETYPKAQVLIAKHKVDLLGRKLRARGITPLVGSTIAGHTFLETIPNRLGTGVDIDSALVVRQGQHAIINLNDNPFDQAQIDSIHVLTQGCTTTVACLPFIGAGSWPQAYTFETPELRQAAEQRKKAQFLSLFQRYCEALNPTVAMPFAGQYFLHGPQLDLNPQRGMADATECKALHRNVWVPADGGHSTLQIMRDRKVTWETEREQPYDWPTVRNWLEHEDREVVENEGVHYRFEREVQVPIKRLPLLKLLQSAALNARAAFRDAEDLWLCFKTDASPMWLSLNIARGGVTERTRVDNLSPRYEITMDARYLYGCLTRLYNWNSARIGSLVQFTQVPAEFDQARYDLMGDFLDALRV